MAPPAASAAASAAVQEARDKMKARFEAVRTGGKGTARRTKRSKHQSHAADDKQLQAQLKRLGVNSIPGIEEVNMFTDSGSVIHFSAPKVQASVSANTYVVTGHSETKRLEELLPGIINQLGPDNLMNLKRIAEGYAAGAGAKASAAAAADEEIDERARKVLTELQQRMGASVALNVLKELEVKVEKEDIRNVSSFVFSMVRQRLQGAPQAAPLSFAPANAGVQGRQPLLQAPPSYTPPASAAAQRGQPRQQAPMSRAATPGGTASLSWIQETLEAYGLKGRLDEAVLEKMMVAQPERLMEIFQDLADMGDRVRNPSAFIQKSLKDFSEPRKRTAGSALDAGGWSTQKRPHVEPSDDPFVRHRDVVSRMDEAAVAKLKGHPDQGRVRDILSEMSSKIADIRNPSAFVVRALSDPSRAAGY